MSPDDMLREAEARVAREPCPENWQRLAEVRVLVGWKSPADLAREAFNQACADSPGYVIKAVAMLAPSGHEFYYRVQRPLAEHGLGLRANYPPSV